MKMERSVLHNLKVDNSQTPRLAKNSFTSPKSTIYMECVTFDSLVKYLPVLSNDLSNRAQSFITTKVRRHNNNFFKVKLRFY